MTAVGAAPGISSQGCAPTQSLSVGWHKPHTTHGHSNFLDAADPPILIPPTRTRFHETPKQISLFHSSQDCTRSLGAASLPYFFLSFCRHRPSVNQCPFPPFPRRAWLPTRFPTYRSAQGEKLVTLVSNSPVNLTTSQEPSPAQPIGTTLIPRLASFYLFFSRHLAFSAHLASKGLH